MKPNFLVIGALKCGTTSLCYSLGKHPQVFMCDPKEPHFFGRKPDPKKTIEWYESLFDKGLGKIAIGEGSTSYTHPDIIRQAAADIAEYTPKCRLLYMVRNPIKRLESDWKMRRHEGWAPASINEAVKSQPTLTTQGMYWKNVNEYRWLFSDKQILIVFLEDFSRDPDRELKRCFDHVNVDASKKIDVPEKPLNESRGYRKDRIISRYLRGTSFFEGMKAFMPNWLRGLAKTTFTRKEDLVVRWEEQVRRSVIAELWEDSQKFLEYSGKPLDFWDL